MLAERGERLDEAVQLVQRALKIEPDNPSFLDSLGWAYLPAGPSRSGRCAADAGGCKAPEQLRRAGAPRRSPIQAAALRRRGICLGTRALGRRPVSRPSQDREEASRRTLPHGPSVIPSSRAVGICRAALAAVLGLCAFVSACGPKAPTLPSGGGALHFPTRRPRTRKRLRSAAGVRNAQRGTRAVWARWPPETSRPGSRRLLGARTRPSRSPSAVRAACVHLWSCATEWRRSC